MSTEVLSEQQGAYSVFKSGVINKNSNYNNPVPFPNFNETICFGGDSKSFIDIVYNSEVRKSLNLSIEILINDSETSRLAGRNKKNEERGIEIRIPRPQNAWIIYRRDKSLEFEGLKSSVISGRVSKKWRNEPKEVLEYFAALAMLANEIHTKKYGKEYKYQPRQRARMAKKLKNNNKQKEKRVIRKENIENTKPETMIPTPASLPLTPPSPYEYLPTPTSSIQHSPVYLPSLVNNGYLPTPASTIQSSPVSSEGDYSSDNILEFSDVDPSGLELFVPSLSEITLSHVVSDQNPLMSDEFTKFLINAENLTTSTLPATTTTLTPETPKTPETQFYSNECGLSMDASPESTMDISIQPSVTNNIFFGYNSFTHYDLLEWQINNASLYPDQMDYVSEYNTIIDQPSH